VLGSRDRVAVVSVRRVEPDDAHLLRTVRLAALKDAPAAFESTHAAEAIRSDQGWVDRAVAGSTGSGRATFFAEESGVVVGLVGGNREDESDGLVELVSMWVAPRFRRRGVGRALIEAVITWAETDGAEVALWVTCGNTPATNLYQSMGFLSTGEQKSLPSDPSKTEARMVRSLRALRSSRRA
jgi:ribosomal protein S18 acetylase RimI-like enzyme